MPTWLLSSLGSLAGLARSPLIRTGLFSGGGTLAGYGVANALGFTGGEGMRRRRRRRRALTASDKADIAFIQGILGQKAGKDFAMIIAARGR